MKSMIAAPFIRRFTHDSCQKINDLQIVEILTVINKFKQKQVEKNCNSIFPVLFFRGFTHKMKRLI